MTAEIKGDETDEVRRLRAEIRVLRSALQRLASETPIFIWGEGSPQSEIRRRFAGFTLERKFR